MKICLIAGLLVLVGTVRDECYKGLIASISPDGKTTVILSEDRTKVYFFVRSEKLELDPAGEVALPKGFGGCGELLVIPDGEAFFFLRNEGREEEDGRRLLFCRINGEKGRIIFKTLTLKDLGLDPETCTRSISHTRLLEELEERAMKLDEKKGEVKVGKVRLSTKDASRVTD